MYGAYSMMAMRNFLKSYCFLPFKCRKYVAQHWFRIVNARKLTTTEEPYIL